MLLVCRSPGCVCKQALVRGASSISYTYYCTLPARSDGDTRLRTTKTDHDLASPLRLLNSPPPHPYILILLLLLID